jgi:hypothetical protein
VDSPIPLRVAKLQTEDEQEFLRSAAALDLGRENIANPVACWFHGHDHPKQGPAVPTSAVPWHLLQVAYLMQLITRISGGQRQNSIVTRCIFECKLDCMQCPASLCFRCDFTRMQRHEQRPVAQLHACPCSGFPDSELFMTNVRSSKQLPRCRRLYTQTGPRLAQEDVAVRLRQLLQEQGIQDMQRFKLPLLEERLTSMAAGAAEQVHTTCCLDH